MSNKNLFLIALLFIPAWVYGQREYKVTTVDVTNFWQAYDLLKDAKSRDDSIAIMQQNYIDVASPFFQEFIRIRKFTAEEYVKKIGRYPKFWQSIRSRTEGIADRKDEIKAVYSQFSNFIPGFAAPDVCFAIGCLRTGGTVSGNLVLIGSEITLADSTTDTSELRPQLQSVLGTLGGITSMVAHETVHVLQSGRTKHHLLKASISEGVADYITTEFLGLNINPVVHAYGNAHECEIWHRFQNDIKESPKDYTNWLYNGSKVKSNPADLGYFIGSKIAESYYQQSSDKEEALKTLLNRSKYKQVYKRSGYTGNCH